MKSGVLPTRNFQESYFENADEFSGETMTEKYLIKKEACFACPIACGRFTQADDIKTGGPEFESVWVFTANCGSSDMKAAIKANYWCNEMGLDTISAGATIATAMELYEKGIIKDEELEGLSLKFGDSSCIVEWVKRIGRSEGVLAKENGRGLVQVCGIIWPSGVINVSQKTRTPGLRSTRHSGSGATICNFKQRGMSCQGLSDFS